MDDKKIIVLGNDQDHEKISDYTKQKSLYDAITVSTLGMGLMAYSPAHSIDSKLDRLLGMESESKGRKCLLPECRNYTDHNRGYCCAEHCKLHRKSIKQEELTNKAIKKLDKIIKETNHG